jgi:hypothetical protein
MVAGSYSRRLRVLASAIASPWADDAQNAPSTDIGGQQTLTITVADGGVGGCDGILALDAEAIIQPIENAPVEQ